jgi:hypothetical protein
LITTDIEQEPSFARALVTTEIILYYILFNRLGNRSEFGVGPVTAIVALVCFQSVLSQLGVGRSLCHLVTYTLQTSM